MKLDEYVYCTRCKNFDLKLALDIEDCQVTCKYQNDCYFWDWEDGRKYELRKHYEAIE